MKQTAVSTPVPRKRKRRLWLIPVTLVLLMVIAVAAMFFSDMPSRRELQALSIGTIDFRNLQDGTYVGSFIGTKGNLRDATVEATITDGVVSDIRILGETVDETGAPPEIGDGMSVYDLFDTVVAQKTMQVDVVSGATLTSKAYLKALENALQQAQFDDSNNNEKEQP